MLRQRNADARAMLLENSERVPGSRRVAVRGNTLPGGSDGGMGLTLAAAAVGVIAGISKIVPAGGIGTGEACRRARERKVRIESAVEDNCRTGQGCAQTGNHRKDGPLPRRHRPDGVSARSAT